MPVVEGSIQANGLLVDVTIGPSAPLRALLWRRGQHAPPAVTCTLVVDTGADTTMLSEQTMRSLALTATSQTRVVTSTTGAKGELCDVHGVELILFPSALQPLKVGALEVLSRPLLNQGTDGLLGRDVLSLVVLTVDGPRRTFRIAY